jgi:hypothetical protein
MSVDAMPYQVGQNVTSPMWGPGVVIAATPKVTTVDFGAGVVKRMSTALAPKSMQAADGLRWITFDADKFEGDVREEVRKANLRKLVQDALRAEQEPPGEPFDAGTLAEVLRRPAEPPMRVAGLIPSDASTLVVAQRKTGKTTLLLNYARSLLTGEELLGRFDVRPTEGAVALLNYEVSGATVARWADEHDVPRDRLLLVNLRGRRNPLTHPEDRARLVALLRAHDTEAIVIDPFGRAYTGKSQNDSGEVGAWLVDLDVFTRSEVGATDLLLAAHAGWNGERTRGASALEDWADVIVTLTRDGEDESQRFLRAIGRDVDVEEDRLDFNVDTRTLTLAGTGSRRQAKTERKIAELAVLCVRAARETPGVSVSGMETTIRAMDDAIPFRNGEVSKAAKYAQTQGLMRIEGGGPGRRSEHFAYDNVNPSQPIPNSSPGAPSDPSHPSFRGGVRGLVPASNKPLPMWEGSA